VIPFPYSKVAVLFFVFSLGSAPILTSEEEIPTLPESWRHATGGAIRGILRDDTGNILAASEDRYLYRFDSEGDLIERMGLREKPAGGITSLPDGSFCVLLRRGVAHLNTMGREIWFRRTEEAPLGRPSTDRYGYIYYSRVDGFVESVTHTGRLRWRTRIDGPVTTGFILDPSTGRGIVAGGDRVSCLNFTGSEVWSRKYPGYSFLSAEVLDAGHFVLVAPEGIVLVDEGGMLVQKVSFSTVRDIRGIFPAGGGRFFVYSRSGFLWELRRSGDVDTSQYLSRDAWYLGEAGGITDITLGRLGGVIGTDNWLVQGYELPFEVPSRKGGPGYDLYAALGDGSGYLYLKALEEAGSRGNMVRILDEIENELDAPSGEDGPAHLFILESIIHGRNPDTAGKTGGYAWDGALRSRAVDLLGVTGNLATIRMLRNEAVRETHPDMILSSIQSLGRLASDPEGKSIAVIAELSDRNNRISHDPRIAAATISALERIDSYQPSRQRRGYGRTLLEIFYGDYPREVRQNAIRVLEMSP
jgi:hypothetical protein